MIFKDRKSAGRKLAKELKDYKGRKDCIVIALPRGGVVLGVEVSQYLNLPLDLVVPRKIGAPGNSEYAIGAITEDGERIINEPEVKNLGISKEFLEKEIKKEMKEAQRRIKLYRGKSEKNNLSNKTVILVDDGIATGLTMKAAIKSVKKKGAKKIIIAVPVSARDSIREISNTVDNVVCLHAPAFFGAVGVFYRQFSQVEDEEVIQMMNK